MTDNATDKEVTRIRELLRRAVRVAGVPNKEIEARLNMSSGSLSRLFAGGIELKVKHVLDILGQIEMTPGDFFRLVYPEDDAGGSETAIALKGFLGHGRPERTESARRRSGSSEITQEEVEAMVAKALRRLLLGSEVR